jgi:hypothetical protein
LVVFESCGVDGFASWETLFELGDTSNDSNHSSNSFGWVLVLDGGFKLLESGIEHKKGFVFISDALKKGKKIELSAESLQDSLLNLGKLNLLFRSSKLKS